LEFLHQLWPNDEEPIEALRDWFGYVLSGRTDLQKIFMIIGPLRSGKGTISRILTAMIGRGHVANPTLSSLGTEFGLAPLLGKSLAVIGDARLGSKTDSRTVIERLLSISGEDAITVNRKFRDQVSVRLPTRFMIISNELPRVRGRERSNRLEVRHHHTDPVIPGQGKYPPRAGAPSGAPRDPELGARRTRPD
jgi:putative DNA primase/helicase